jgi:hypothetical protein
MPIQYQFSFDKIKYDTIIFYIFTFNETHHIFLMNQMVIISILLLTFSTTYSLLEIYSDKSEIIYSILTNQDTLKNNQVLYSGKVWKNMYRRINGDQFLFTDYFLDGTVTANGRTYKNLKIKYDIYSDEILIPVDLEEIVQVNKEIIDSFSISYENRNYLFEKIVFDSLKHTNDFNGYFHVLYKDKSALYVKYSKQISPNITDKSDGDFIETKKVWLVKGNTVYPISSENDLLNALNIDKMTLKNCLRSNKLKYSKKKPESLIPIIRYYDSISQ